MKYFFHKTSIDAEKVKAQIDNIKIQPVYKKIEI